MILRPKSLNRSCRFWGPNRETIHHLGFETQPKNPPPVLRSNWEKPSLPVLRPTRRKSSQWFWCQTTDKPSTLILRLNQETHALHLHVHGVDHTRRHPTSRSSSHRVPDLGDHPGSSAPGLLLLPYSSSLPVMPHLPPTHHETNKYDSPHDTKIKVRLSKCPEFEFKSR
jgi:hypothetical protein